MSHNATLGGAELKLWNESGTNRVRIGDSHPAYRKLIKMSSLVPAGQHYIKSVRRPHHREFEAIVNSRVWHLAGKSQQDSCTSHHSFGSFSARPDRRALLRFAVVVPLPSTRTGSPRRAIRPIGRRHRDLQGPQHARCPRSARANLHYRAARHLADRRPVRNVTRDRREMMTADHDLCPDNPFTLTVSSRL